MPETILSLNWFRLLGEPVIIMALFLLLLAEPESRIRTWRNRRKNRQKRRNVLDTPHS